MSRYRDELEALRAQKEKLEEEVAQHKAALAAAEQRLAERHRPIGSGAAARHIRPDPAPAAANRRRTPATDDLVVHRRVVADPPGPEEVRPSIGPAVLGCVTAPVFGAIGVALALAAGPTMQARMPGFGLLLVVPILIVPMVLRFTHPRRLGFSERGLELVGSGRRMLVRWRDAGDLRVERNRATVVLFVECRRTGWHELGVGYDVEGVRWRMDRWKAYREAREVLRDAQEQTARPSPGARGARGTES